MGNAKMKNKQRDPKDSLSRGQSGGATAGDSFADGAFGRTKEGESGLLSRKQAVLVHGDTLRVCLAARLAAQ